MISYNKMNAMSVGCASSGIFGLCCPTADGSMLPCCDSSVGGEKRMQEEWKSLIYIDHAGMPAIHYTTLHYTLLHTTSRNSTSLDYNTLHFTKFYCTALLNILTLWSVSCFTLGPVASL